MANTLTDLTPNIYAALDVVSRELVGLVSSVSRDSSLQRAALNQTIRSFVAPSASSNNITPGQLPQNDGDQVIGNKTITISKAKYVAIRHTGEEEVAMNSGPGMTDIMTNQFAQAMRVLANEVEADLASLYAKASRAVSPAGTTLFDAANYKDIANVRKILVDNGADPSSMTLVLNTLAGASLRGNAQYVGSNTAGSDSILRQGVLLDVHGMAIKESAQIKTHTPGTGSGLKTSADGFAVGSTSITVATDGSGTIVAGDVITFAGDTNKYVVTTGGDMGAGGTVVIAAPGLLKAISTTQVDIAIESSADRNMAFSRNAIHLITRAPARPAVGDLARDVMLVQDPRSGLGFEISMYEEYRRVRFEVALAWGYEVIKPEHLALLID